MKKYLASDKFQRASSVHRRQPNEGISHPDNQFKIRFIVVISSMLNFIKLFFPSAIPTKVLWTYLISPMLATCPGNLKYLDFVLRDKWIMSLLIM